MLYLLLVKTTEIIQNLIIDLKRYQSQSHAEKNVMVVMISHV